MYILMRICQAALGFSQAVQHRFSEEDCFAHYEVSVLEKCHLLPCTPPLRGSSEELAARVSRLGLTMQSTGCAPNGRVHVKSGKITFCEH